MEDVIGRVIAGRYRLEERIGVGAMGVVYRARHVRLGRAFAVKLVHPQLLTRDKVRRRFQREAELAASLRHDNVIGVVDVGETVEGCKYLVMDFADGDTLATIISRGPLPGPRVLRIVRQLCDGLQHAHDAGLIHRDFKPDNVIVAGDTPRIVDFGIALLRDDATATDRERLTTAGIVLGTPHYMAPEHASGKPIDHRADLFALGVTCFEMLTGAPPFEGDGVDVAYANMTKDMPAMRDVAPGVEVDPLLEAFTRKLMARSLDARLASARAARELLDLIEDDRDAARAALGLAPAPVAPPVSRPVMAMPALSPRARPVSISSGSVTHPDALCDTLQMRAITGRSRTRVAVAAAVAAGMLVVALVALRDNPAPAPKIAAARIEAPSPPTTPVVRELPPATVIMTVPAPPPSPPVARVLPPTTAIVAVRPTPPTVRTPPSVRPRTVAPPTVATHAPTVPQRVPPPPAAVPYVTPSAAELARYYAVIGRKLAQLDHAHGQPATLELWPRYRRLRIQSLLANPDDRRAGAAELRTIERLIDAAMRSSP